MCCVFCDNGESDIFLTLLILLIRHQADFVTYLNVGIQDLGYLGISAFCTNTDTSIM